MIRRLKSVLVLAPVLLPTACAMQPPPTQADQVNASACTAQADAAYNNQNIDALSRTSQNGVRFAPDPSRVFDSQRLGDLSARDSQINACENTGANAPNISPATQIAVPQIVTQ